MKPGDLFTFDRFTPHGSINGKLGIFLGQRTLTRDDGKVIPNFAVQIFGESTERLCDASMKRWMKPMEVK